MSPNPLPHPAMLATLLSDEEVVFDSMDDLPERTFAEGAYEIDRIRLTRLEGDLQVLRRIEIETPQVRFLLPRRIHHHATGQPLDWAHFGPRSKDLALNLLLAFLSPKEAWRHHERFAREVLRPLAPEEAVLEGSAVRRWIEQQWLGETWHPAREASEASDRRIHENRAYEARIRHMSVQERAEHVLKCVRRKDYGWRFLVLVQGPAREAVLREVVQQILASKELLWIVDNRELPIYRLQIEFEQNDRERAAGRMEAMYVPEPAPRPVLEAPAPAPAPPPEALAGSPALRRFLRTLPPTVLQQLMRDLSGGNWMANTWLAAHGLSDDPDEALEAIRQEYFDRFPRVLDHAYNPETGELDL